MGEDYEAFSGMAADGLLAEPADAIRELGQGLTALDARVLGLPGDQVRTLIDEVEGVRRGDFELGQAIIDDRLKAESFTQWHRCLDRPGDRARIHGAGRRPGCKLVGDC